MRTSRSNMRRLRSGSIGSISAWLPSRRSTLHHRGARVITRRGHVRSGSGIGRERAVLVERHRSRRTGLRRHGCSPYVSASGCLRRAAAPDARAVSPCCSLLQRSGAPSQGGGSRRSGSNPPSASPGKKKPLRASERLWARAETARAYVRRRLELSALISFMLPGILHAFPTAVKHLPRPCNAVRHRAQPATPGSGTGSSAGLRAGIAGRGGGQNEASWKSLAPILDQAVKRP